MAHGQRTVRTAKKREQFLAALRSNGTVFSACQAAGIGRTAAYEWRAADESFRAAWDEALEDATDQLEHEAVRRATDGSDTLLIFLLKANRPEKYRDNTNVTMKATHEHSGPNGNPIALSFDANTVLARIAGGSEADR